MLEGKFHL